MTKDHLDPREMIKESYRIEGISAPECRSIFLDWALGIAPSADMHAMITELLAIYAPTAPDHPMTGVLNDGLAPAATSMRRGGRKARLERDSP